MDNQTLPPEQNEPSVVKFEGPRDVLIAARKLIEKPEQWGKGRRREHRPFDTFCMAEAIEDTTFGQSQIRSRAYALVRRAANMGTMPMTDWNDAPGRTHADVLAVFDRAIEQCAVGDRESSPTGTEVA